MKSVKLIMETYPHPVTANTLGIWCEMVRSKFYLWDKKACTGEIVALIKSYVTEHIPLTSDFREFNRDIFGIEWSDRRQLVEQCLALNAQLSELQERYEHVLEMLRLLQDNGRC